MICGIDALVFQRGIDIVKVKKLHPHLAFVADCSGALALLPAKAEAPAVAGASV